MTNGRLFRRLVDLSPLVALVFFYSVQVNGNVTATGSMPFTYASKNHKMTMSATGTSVTMVYDGDGNRVAKTVIANGVPTTTYYLVNDLNPTGYPQVVEELNSAFQVQRQYTYGLQRIDEEQMLQGAWTPSFYGYDGGGNVRQLTDVTGKVTDSYEYDAFGNALQTSGSTPNVYLYRGEQYDSDLQLYYLRARYYNPVTGRFMSRDSIDPQLIDSNGIPIGPQYLHKYLYANGDPLNGVDPSGRGVISYALNLVKSTATAVVEGILYSGKVRCALSIAVAVLNAVTNHTNWRWAANYASLGLMAAACFNAYFPPAPPPTPPEPPFPWPPPGTPVN